LSSYLLKKCVCGEDHFDVEVHHDLCCIRCTSCGLLRSGLSITLKELEDYYETQYFNGVYTHSVEQDDDLAIKRLKSYGLFTEDLLLDIGCGFGSFVSLCRENGINAYGQDLATAESESSFIFHEALHKVMFPTDNFEVITMHDVYSPQS